MARQKQAAPLQRATSSELMHMPPDDSQSLDKKMNGKSSVTNGSASGKHAAQENAPDTPGLMQLAICVLGIYASLYVSRSWCQELLKSLKC